MNILDFGLMPGAASLGQDLFRILTLQDYNTRVVLTGSLLLGISAGLVGTFMLLRKRALVGDVISHASLPGIAVAFIVLEMAQQGAGKSLSGLTIGAVISGCLAIAITRMIRISSRIRDDAALAIVLSLFFGAGISLLTMIQDMPAGSAAGLDQFIFGRTASMTADDIELLAVANGVTLLVCLGFFKEFSLLCFDESYAGSMGWPTGWIDGILMALVIAVTVIGQQSVGLLLVVAMLIVPAVSARFWTHRISVMAVLSGVIGALSALIGGVLSALFPRLAAGAIMVLVGGLLFVASFLFGKQRGIVPDWYRRRRTRRRADIDDLLRSLYELIEIRRETAIEAGPEWCHVPVPVEDLHGHRHWNDRRLLASLKHASNRGWIEHSPDHDRVAFSAAGVMESSRAVRNHRLWELFLLHYADIAPAHVDRQADVVEHVLEPELVFELEKLLKTRHGIVDVPPCPHSEDLPK